VINVQRDTGTFRTLLLLVLGIAIILSVFAIFSVRYAPAPPLGPSTSELRLFQPQYNDSSGLGEGTTYFHRLLSNRVEVEGFIESGGEAVADSSLIVTMFPVETVTNTSGTGYYSYRILYTGKGVFDYEIAGYYPKAVTINAYSKVVWVNVSMKPLPVYNFEVRVHDELHNPVAYANLYLYNYFINYSFEANLTGQASIQVFQGNYSLVVYRDGYSNISLPLIIRSNRSVSVTLPEIQSGNYTVSGFIRDGEGVLIGNALIYTTPPYVRNTSLQNGSFAIHSVYGNITLHVFAAGFLAFIMNLTVNSDTSINITLMPDNTLGPGLMLVSNYTYTGFPAVDFATLNRTMPAMIEYSALNGTAEHLNLFIHNAPARLQTLLYIRRAGYYYRGVFNITDGAMQLTVDQPLQSEIGLLTLNYSPYFTYVHYNQSTVSLYLSHANLTNTTIGIISALNSKPVPVGNVTLHMLLQPYIAVSQKNETVFSMKLPPSNYTFTYSDISYVPLTYSFSTFRPVNVTLRAREYAVVVISNTSLDWNYTLKFSSGLNYSGRISSTTTIPGSAGFYTLRLNAGNLTLGREGQLNYTYPLITLYINGSELNENASVSTFSLHGSTFYENMSVNLTALCIISEFTISGLNFTLNRSILSFLNETIGFSGNNVSINYSVMNLKSMGAEITIYGVNATEAMELTRALFSFTLYSISATYREGEL